MYKNPSNNNGDLSDYNSLKNIKNNSEIIKKYSSKKLKSEPTELQKYYEYLTYQQPILDEINYTAEKLKTENIKKQKEDFEFLEKLKEEREKKMKGVIDKTETKTEKDRIKESLFDEQPKQKDITPSFQTENELELEIRDRENIDYSDSIVLDLDAGKPTKKIKKMLLEDTKNALSYNQPTSTKKKLLLKDIKNELELEIRDRENIDYIDSVVLDLDAGKPTRKINKLLLEAPKTTKKQQNINFYDNIAVNLPIKNKEPIILGQRKVKRLTDEERAVAKQEARQERVAKNVSKKASSTIASQADTEFVIIPKKNINVGRPKGKKNQPKRTLDIRPTSLKL